MKLNTGDFFTIPIDEKRTGIGQIVNIPNKNSFIIIVFDSLWEINFMPVKANFLNFDILLLGYTVDSKLYNKHWTIIGNTQENIDSIYLPYFKLGTPPDDIYIVNYKGDRIRQASMDEFDLLKYQSIVAPIRYENALKAHFNLADWDNKYDELLYSYTLDSIKIGTKKQI